MTIWDKIFTYKVFAMRGYTSLVGWMITIGTFAMILYGYLIESLPILLIVFPNVFVFMLISIPIGLIVLTFLGRWDWKKGTFPKEGAIAFQNNPEWVEHRTETNDRIDNIENKLEYMSSTLNDILKLLLEEE